MPQEIGKHNLKLFSIFHPFAFNYTEMYPVASYKETYPGEFKVEPNETGDKVKWIPVDPLKPDLGKWPLYGKARPIHCSLHPGEMLYLPSMWYHHVRQGEGTIAGEAYTDMSNMMKKKKE